MLYYSVNSPLGSLCFLVGVATTLLVLYVALLVVYAALKVKRKKLLRELEKRNMKPEDKDE